MEGHAWDDLSPGGPSEKGNKEEKVPENVSPGHDLAGSQMPC